MVERSFRLVGGRGMRSRELEQRRDGVRLEWPREEIALPGIAVLALELGQLRALLDALGERLQVERLAEAHEDVDEGRRLLRRRHGADEAAVDLDRVDRELAQVGERAVTGAEVVDREAHAQLLD